MNIKQAKQEIIHTVRAAIWTRSLWRISNSFGTAASYVLMGPPGIGKTQIMEQICSRNGDRFGCVYHYTPYKTKCVGTAIY